MGKRQEVVARLPIQIVNDKGRYRALFVSRSERARPVTWTRSRQTLPWDYFRVARHPPEIGGTREWIL